MNEKFNRADWIATAALMLTVAAQIFNLGVLWQTQQDHSRRIEEQEAKMDTLGPKVERIDANVTFLTDLAREERNRKEDR
jgi:cell division protein FtsB